MSVAVMIPHGTEARVCALIATRQAMGMAKYGTSVADNPLELREWLQHALEETLDKAIYLQRAIEEIDNKGLAIPRDELADMIRAGLGGTSSD